MSEIEKIIEEGAEKLSDAAKLNGQLYELNLLAKGFESFISLKDVLSYIKTRAKELEPK